MKREPEFEGVTLVVDAKRIGTPILATIPGRFLRRHPARADDFVRPGQRVAAGSMLGLVAVGLILVPVIMPEDGLVLSLASPEGRAVGYGEALVEIVTLGELAKIGITS